MALVLAIPFWICQEGDDCRAGREHLYFRKIVGMDWLLGHRSPGQIQPNCVAPWHAVDDEPTIRHLSDREGERLGH
jgi:hypothetical protein